MKPDSTIAKMLHKNKKKLQDNKQNSAIKFIFLFSILNVQNVREIKWELQTCMENYKNWIS